MIWLHAGSNFNGGTTNTANTWVSNATTANYVDSSSTSFFDSTDRTFFLTGLQMEVGSVATPFEHRSFGEELALCQRYFYNSAAITAGFHNGTAVANNKVYGTGYFFPVPMRTTPSTIVFTSFAGTAGKLAQAADNADTGGTLSASVQSNIGIHQILDNGTAFTDNEGYFSKLKVDAEL